MRLTKPVPRLFPPWNFVPPKTDQNGCGGILCCSNAPCAACASVTVDTSMPLPPWVCAVVLFPDFAPGASIGPQELSRPPDPSSDLVASLLTDAVFGCPSPPVR